MVWSESARIAAENNGLTLAEFVVLQQAMYRAGFNAERMASVIVAECDLLDLPFDEDDYLDAIDSCIEKGLLRILTDADLDDATDLGTSYSFPQFNFKGWHPGAVDFMPRGYELTHRAIDEFRQIGVRSGLVGWLQYMGQQLSHSNLKSSLLIYGTCEQLGRYLLDAADRISVSDDRDIEFLFQIFEKDSPLYYITEKLDMCDMIFGLLQRLTSKKS